MGMGSPVNNAMQQAPQRIGGKGSNMPRQTNNAPMNPAQPGTPPRPDIFVRPTGAAPTSPFEFQPAAQPGTLNPMGDTFVRPINPAMDGSSIAPQPIGGKGGGVAGMPLGMAQPQMPPPGMPQQQMPPGYSQPLFDKQQRLNEQIAQFQQKRFGDMTPDNMAQMQEAVQDKFGNRMDKLGQMRQQMMTRQAPMQAQSPISGLGALAQNAAYRNLLG